METHFRSVLEAAPDAMLIVAPSGRIDVVNRQLERLFGYAREELLGQAIECLIPERHRHAHAAHVSAYFAAPSAREMGTGLELLAARKDGSEFPAEISLMPMHTKDGVLVTAAIRDLTERKRLELSTLEASRSKSEFLASMSHELRTPLNSIIGFAELMYRGKVGPLAPEHREYLGDILTSSRHLQRLINDLLDLAKLESEKLELRPEVVSLATLVVDVRDVLRELAYAKQLRIEVDVSPELASVVVDPVRVKQILYNYVSNAIQFTGDGGRIVIRALALDDRRFRLEVEDTGIGVAADEVALLFGELRRSSARSAKRTGLGLLLTKHLVEAHGGSVGVTSELGVGSTFYAILPRDSEQGKRCQESRY